MTKWTDEGITHFKGISTAMRESVLELMRLFTPVLAKEWYSMTERQLIDKASGVLAENNYSRNDVLLIFDNTETLASSSQDIQELGTFFKMIGKKIGRIIITSRRREFIEATPILVEGLSDQESIRLINTLAKEYNAEAIIKAGESRLRRVSKKLMNKPLLIDTLVKYISRSGKSIDASLDNIFKKTDKELLEFLYEDAWLRMNNAQQEVFQVLVLVSCPLDKYSIRKACQEIGIQHTEFQSSFSETYFGTLTDYGKNYSLTLVELANRFFLQQFKKLSEEKKLKLKEISNLVDQYAIEQERIEKEYKSDRVAEAFRSEYARSAKISADKGNVQEAIEMYELAILDDPLNSALHDRFSWLLFNRKQDYKYAEEMSKKAIHLDDNNCDALVNIALIYYRLGKIELGDEYIDKAELSGRPKSFCLLRKAIARYHHSKNMPDINKSISTLEGALERLNLATTVQLNEKVDNYYLKNRDNIEKYISLTKVKLRNLRTKQTRMAL